MAEPAPQPNSYVVPAAFPLEAGEIYYWRVRPRIQGDGDPLPWSASLRVPRRRARG